MDNKDRIVRKLITTGLGIAVGVGMSASNPIDARGSQKQADVTIYPAASASLCVDAQEMVLTDTPDLTIATFVDPSIAPGCGTIVIRR